MDGRDITTKTGYAYGTTSWLVWELARNRIQDVTNEDDVTDDKELIATLNAEIHNKRAAMDGLDGCYCCDIKQDVAGKHYNEHVFVPGQIIPINTKPGQRERAKRKWEAEHKEEKF